MRTLREACAVVPVFSEAANDGDEIKKELSLASRFQVPVMALRVEDVEPSDAFATNFRRAIGSMPSSTATARSS